MLDRLIRKLFGRSVPPAPAPFLPPPVLSPREAAIYNEGERLIPGVTHGLNEMVRHRSSYAFFRAVIEADLARGECPGGARILDMGCGVGHGCHLLARIPGVRVHGVDLSPDCVSYAREQFGGSNITYLAADLRAFVPSMPEFDYVVSRGVLEHIPEGLSLAVSARWRRRLLFDVPYDEPGGPNPHHVITGIREEQFDSFAGAELFYEDLYGAIYDASRKPPKPNMILCACAHPGLPPVGGMGLRFPLPPAEIPEGVPGGGVL